MKKTIFSIIIYVLGLIFGALVLGLWDAETNIIKPITALVWTIIFLIALFYADKYDQK
tara:strand:+ start:92 stop:265 length:174 start_codon:yes stop_codon:yes gene_type:complete